MKQRGKAVRGDERVGRFIDGRYRIVELLAVGAMARVYRAEQKDPPCELAVKVLGREIAVHKTAAARFHREARAASRLDHPGIVRIYGWGVSGDVPFIAMELLKGRDLFAVLEREERLSQERGVRLAMHICDALQAAHDSGVVHRDLKPENVMVLDRDANGDERIKLLDFGIAKMAPRAEHAYNDETFPQVLTKVGSAVGTPSHMAPEQARGVGVDGRADVYALGVLLYEMVTGHLPFEGSNPIDVAVRQVREAPPPPSRYLPEIHRGLERIILRCLEKDPVARWQNARDVAGELGRVLSDLIGEEPVTQQNMEPADEDELPTRERDVRDVRSLLNKLLPVRSTMVLDGHNEPSTDSLETQPGMQAYDPQTFDSLTDVTSPGPGTISDITKPGVSARPISTMRAAHEPHPGSTLRAGQLPDTEREPLRSHDVSLRELEPSSPPHPTPGERTDEDDLTTLNMEAPARVTKEGPSRARLVTEEDDTTTMPQEERKKEIIRAIAEARRQAERLATQELQAHPRPERTAVLDEYEPPRSRARFDASLSLPPPPPQPQPAQHHSAPPTARDPQEELESLLKRVPAKRSVFPAIALVFAILIAGALLYVAFYGVPNTRVVRDIVRFFRGLI